MRRQLGRGHESRPLTVIVTSHHAAPRSGTVQQLKGTAIHLSGSLYQSLSKRVFYFLYAALLFQLIGQVLTVLFTFFYLDYVHDGMTFALPLFARASKSIHSSGSTTFRRAGLCMPNNQIGTVLLDVRIPLVL